MNFIKRTLLFLIVTTLTLLLSGLPAANMVQGAQADLVITEIMYNPKSNPEGRWEWVEIYNAGPGSVDLSGFVFDDDDSSPLSGSNIASGVIASGDTAVLFNANTPTADFIAAWGTDVNAIPVSSWSGLNNTNGDRVGLWNSFASYDGGNSGTWVNPIDSVTYDDGAGAGNEWPDSTDGASIYLLDAAAGSTSNDSGSAWGLSVSGQHGAFSGASDAAGNAASPMVLQEPVPTGSFIIYGNIQPNEVVAGNTFSFIGGITNISESAIDAKIEARITGTGFDERVIPGDDVPLGEIPTQTYSIDQTRTGTVVFTVDGGTTAGAFVYTVNVDVNGDGTVDDSLAWDIEVTSSRGVSSDVSHSEWFRVISCEGSICETTVPTAVSVVQDSAETQAGNSLNANWLHTGPVSAPMLIGITVLALAMASYTIIRVAYRKQNNS